jgi:hypothetical protein
LRADNGNVPDHDSAWWSDYVTTLKRAAEDAPQ